MKSAALLFASLLSSCTLFLEELGEECTGQSFCEGAVSVQCINGVELRVQCDDRCEPNLGLCASCGDERLSAAFGEECDDGNTDNTDACVQCRFASCGDGFIQEGVEECEDIGRCNINSIDPTLGPPCQSDDECELTGECLAISGDGCDSQCLIEVCGNGIQQGLPPKIAGVPTSPGFYFEECDDGNNTEADGCTNRCTRDSCGDGLVNRFCIDANNNNECDLAEQSTSPLEDCDEGRQCADGSACLTNADCEALTEDLECRARGSDLCSPSCRFAFCGDGFVSPSEECDDGKQCEDGQPCLADIDCALGFCEVRSGDGCNTQCVTEFCGDGILNSTQREVAGFVFFEAEVCDDGNNAPNDGCRADCSGTEVCGDGLLDTGEECDDGNTIAGDGCEFDCSFICGQGSGASRAVLDSNTNHCYLGFFSTDPQGLGFGLSWFDAEQDCETRGGYLATIESTAENELVAQATRDTNAAWIGFHDLDDEAFGDPFGFVSVVGDPVTFHNFAPGEPNNTNQFGDDDCVVFIGGQWADEGCDNLFIVFKDHLCELEPNPCGDGILQAQLGEQCDDGGVIPGDGCDNICQTE
jgi:cysteine-rich repeat protein